MTTDTTRTKVLAAQMQWATAAGLTPDAKGYLPSFELNLRRPLSAKAASAFKDGDGRELIDREGAPAKMRALHSSSALGVNVFSYWEDQPDLTTLLKALAVDGSAGTLDFERKLPTGARGTSPNLDVVIQTAAGLLVGIESKFTEWMTPKQGFARSLEPYVTEAGSYWSRARLPEADMLARAVHGGDTKFQFLDVPQLLKHALGLEKAAENGFWALRYVYLAAPGEVGESHDEEVQRFVTAVGDELRFSAMSYQTLLGRFATGQAVDAGYLTYLRSRYLAV